LQLDNLRPPNGQTKAFAAEVFKNEEGRLDCTLLAYHGAEYAEPWLLVTDLSAAIAEASWYGLRGWIEQGYKRVKSEGWQMQRTRITCCARLERLWLAMAVATLWVLEVGGESEVQEQGRKKAARAAKQVGEDTPALPDLEESDPMPSQPAAGPEETSGQAEDNPRLWSVFSRGWQLLRNALPLGVVLLASWHPEPWPHHPLAGLPPTPEVCLNNAGRPGDGLPTEACSMNGSHNHDSS
jgi:hypothetical protein